MSAAYESLSAKADEHIRLISSWPTLDELPEEAPTEPQAFPFHGLGKLLGNAARSIAHGVQVPDALAGGSVLASASLAAQTHANVVMPHGQSAPLSLFVITGAFPIWTINRHRLINQQMATVNSNGIQNPT